MKRLLAFALALVMCLCCIPVHAMGTTSTDPTDPVTDPTDSTSPTEDPAAPAVVAAPATAVAITFAVLPAKLEYYQNQDNLDMTGAELVVEYSDGTSSVVPLSQVQLTGFDNTQLGKQTITATYEGLTTSFNVTVVPAPTLTEVQMAKYPQKQFFLKDQDQLDLSTASLRAYYSDKSSQEIPMNDPRVTVTGFDNTVLGVQRLTATFEGMSVTFTVRVYSYTGKCGDDLTYAYDTQTKKLTITGTGAMYDFDLDLDVPWYVFRNEVTEVELPSTMTALGKMAFACFTSLTELNLPDGIPALPAHSVEDCGSLTSLTIPESVKTIGEYALSGNRSLTRLEIPEKVETIGDYAFAFSENLEEVVLPENLKTLGGGAFLCCPALKTVEIPETVSTISWTTFEQCTGLEEITIPQSVTQITYGAFAGCTGLETVIFEGAAPTVDTNGANPYYGSEAFPNLTSDAYYAGGDDTWTAAAKAALGSSLNWIPTYGVEDNSSYEPAVDGLGSVLEEIAKEETEDALVTVSLKVSEEAKAQIPQEEMEQIREEAGNITLEFLEITLEKSVNGETQDIGDSNKALLHISLEYSGLGKRNIVVYRHHGGEVQILTTTANDDGEYIEIQDEKLIIHALKFSTYAIGYEDVGTCTVTFQTNGAAAIDPQVITKGETVAKPANPTLEGASFTGWYTDEALTTAWDFTAGVTTDMTLYAGWASVADVTGIVRGSADMEYENVTAKLVGTGGEEYALTVTKDTDANNWTLTAADIPEGSYDLIFSAKADSITWKWTRDAVITAESTELPTLDLVVVKVTAPAATIYRGRSHTFVATVYGPEGTPTEVNWLVSGAQAADTAIAPDGTLYVGDGETAEKLTVTASLKAGGDKRVAKAVRVKAPPYSITAGNKAKWVKNSKKDLSFTIDGPYEKLGLVLIDGKVLAADNYTDAAKGENEENTVITLKAAYLQKMTNKKHTITVQYIDGGEATGEFNVQSASASAPTGDQFNPTLWIGLMAASAVAAGVLIVAVIRKKRK